jgi:hypothetical protein
MEFQVAGTEARGELERAGDEGEGAGDGVRDEEGAVVDELEAVGVVGGVVEGEKRSVVMKTKSAARPMKSQSLCLEVKRRRAGAGGAGGRVVVGAAMSGASLNLCGPV